MKALLDQLRPGLNVYVQGGAGETLALCAALGADPERAAGVHFISVLIPGMNAFDYAGLTPTTRVTTFMPIDAMKGSTAAGRVRLPPMGYSRIAAWLAQTPIDIAVAHVAPEQGGRFSFGVASDFGPIVWPDAGQCVAIVNERMPRLRGASAARVEADIVIEAPHDLVHGVEPAPSAELQTIARHVASLVPDGAALQSGIGGAPTAALAFLKDRRNLVIRSGLVTEGYRVLAEAGALAPGGHVTALAFGGADFYRFLAESDLCEFADTFVTHGPHVGDVEKFTSINSALEVDLFGQVNVEWRGGQLVSGVGGAPDFLRAARQSRGGCSIIALPATARGGAISRIVARLDSPAVSLQRDDVDTIVTEFGIAELIGKTANERAEALIAIAAPGFQQGLAEAWAKFRPHVRA